MVKKDTLIKLKAQERELRRALIIEAAREVFGQKTYDRVSMAEIAKTAGIAKSSIYTYFKSQEELYAQVTYQDACAFIDDLKKEIKKNKSDVIDASINYFLDYYFVHKSQWRMITHFALHGNKDIGSVDKLNLIGRDLMDVFDMIFVQAGCKTDTRLMAHTLFSCLSGILIAFRNYPGRSEKDRIAHIKKIGNQITMILKVFINT